MTRRLVVRPLAKKDLDEQACYIARDNARAALRFLEAAEAAFNRLQALPQSGKLRRFKSPELSGVRSLPIPGFERYLIFYRPDPATVDVLRVIHAARDLARIFGPESS